MFTISASISRILEPSPQGLISSMKYVSDVSLQKFSFRKYFNPLYNAQDIPTGLLSQVPLLYFTRHIHFALMHSYQQQKYSAQWIFDTHFYDHRPYQKPLWHNAFLKHLELLLFKIKICVTGLWLINKVVIFQMKGSEVRIIL